MQSKRLYIVVSASILVLILHRVTSMSGNQLIQNISSCFLYPVLQAQRIMVEPVKSWLASRQTVSELHSMINSLCEVGDELRAENIQLKAALSYAQAIDEVMVFKNRYEMKGVVAQVLLRQLSSQEHFFLVDAGTSQGVSKDMVAVYKNNLLGRVVAVYPWYSKVQLITDTLCRVAAYCAQTHVQGIHKGVRSTRETMMSYVSHLDTLHAGDLVLSSGEGLVFPQGFALGSITACKPDGLYQAVTVRPNVDFRSIRYCVLLAKGMASASVGQEDHF